MISLSALGLALAGLGLDQLGLIPSDASAEQASARDAAEAPQADPEQQDRRFVRLGSPRVELANRLRAARQAQPAYDLIFASESHDPFAPAAARADARKSAQADAEEVSPLWAPRLSTVIATGQVRSAIIDGVTCTQGQMVPGVGLIVEIKRDSVLIERDGETREFFVRPTGA